MRSLSRAFEWAENTAWARENVALSISGVRQVLRAILDGLEREEQEALLEHQQEGLEAQRDRPLARPGIQLLGLTRSTEHKDIGTRHRIAAVSRQVAVRTMRKHELIIARDLAVYLDSDTQARAAVSNRPDPRGSSAVVSWWERDRSSLAKEELRELVIEAIESYAPFDDALSVLWETEPDDLEQAEIPDEIPEEERVLQPGNELLLPLHALASCAPRSGVDAGTALSEDVLRAEGPPYETRYCWLARLWAIIEDLLPSFSRRESDALQYAVERAGENLHVFLSSLEETGTGREVMAYWWRWLFGDPEANEQRRFLVEVLWLLRSFQISRELREAGAEISSAGAAFVRLRQRRSLDERFGATTSSD